ncbi:M23 family metallopeptidase [Streptosporangium sp. KLBMP 9127]|nr:M23 family metallopeptidase [Streptosporangium sp. KLBMP 9127]
MRSGYLGHLAVVTGALLLTSACGTAGGVAGVPAAAGAEAVAQAPDSVIATIPQATPSGGPQASVQRPAGEEPVRVPPPKISKFAYAFPVKDCKASYSRKLLILPKTTIWADKGCAFVSPVDGTVDEVNTQNRWSAATDRGAQREGLFVTVIGKDGVRYLGGHLDSVSPGIKPGTKVKVGQTLGQIGNSGNARDTASNLYFAISWKTGPGLWWVRRGMVEPWDYLDAWHDGNPTLSPRDEMLKIRRKAGATPQCRTLCASRPATSPSNKPEERKPPKPVEPRPQPSVLEPVTSDPAGLRSGPAPD